MSDIFSISGPAVYTEAGIVKNGEVVIRDRSIFSIGNKKNTESRVLNFPESYSLVPGFIDLHVHGANNKDVMDGEPDALWTIAKTLAAEGTTGFLATTMTAAPKEIEKVLAVVRDVMRDHTKPTGAAILGVHLEGPFISPNKVGAQRKDCLLPLNVSAIQRWQKIGEGAIKLVTLAPELAGSGEFIRYLTQENIVASIGHTDATYAETIAGIDAGCSYATHLFNAMRGIHQREPGAVTAALLSDSVSAEMILDGVHLHPAIVELILKTKTKEKLVLVTDAMRAKCLGEGTYDLGGQSVEVKKGVATLPDGTLAGSVLRLSTAVQNLLKFTNCTLVDAVKMTSENPARILDIFDKKGSIAVKKDADLVVLDEEFNVALTVCEGRVVYER